MKSVEPMIRRADKASKSAPAPDFALTFAPVFVEVCDADGEAGDRADARRFRRESGAHAGVEGGAAVDLIGDDAECEHRAGLRVVAREAAQLALHAEAFGDVAGGGERGLRARSRAGA